MIYRAVFDCNANSSKNISVLVRIHVVGLSSLRSQLCIKKQTSGRRSTTGFARFEKTCFNYDPDQRRWQPWVILVLKSLKEDDVPALFLVVEAMMMTPICRTQAATRASTTTAYLGPKRAVSADTGDVGSR